jgi:hypothetical protein
MKAWRLLVVLVLPVWVLVASCLGDRVVGPEEGLPAVLAIDRPTVQLFRFAMGRMVPADTVRISNNGEGSLGPVQQVGGVDYRDGRSGWLRTRVVNVGPNDALLILEPTYAEEEQEEADRAEVVLKGAGSPDLKRVTVLARTLRGASFDFSVSPLAFAAAPGDPTSSQVFTVRNGGNGTLIIRPPRIQYEGPAQQWLTVSRAGGSETAPVFQVWADPSGLTGGLYRAQLVFESLPGEETRARTASLEAQLDVGQPQLGLSAPTLGFSVVRGEAAPPSQMIRVSNVGAGAFSSLGAVRLGPVIFGPGSGGWLGADLKDGQVDVRVDPVSLPAGDHTATFNVLSDNGGSRAVQVALSVEAPLLTPSARSLAFGLVKGEEGLPAPQLVRLTNTGSGSGASLGAITLGAMLPEVAWINAVVQERELTVTPTASAAVLPVGSHVTRIPVHSAFGGSDTVSVTLSVSPGTDEAVLALSASEVSFRGIRGDPSPPPHTVRVSNAGGGSLGGVTLGTITYEGASGWLSASLADTALVLSAETGPVPAGTHLATVPVNSGAGGSASVEVVFTVVSPVLTASASSASLSAVVGGAPGASREILLSNTGPGTFSSLGALSVGSVTYLGGSGWLGVSLSGATLTLSLTSVPASAGVYSANVPMTSAHGGSLSVKVELTVARAPESPRLVASPTQVRMNAVRGGDPPPSQVVLLSNGGGGSLGTLGAQTSSPWLAVSLVGSEVTLSASPGSLTSGTYSATVTLTSGAGGNESVEVVLAVGAPLLTLSSNSASFSAVQDASPSPASVSVTISNGGAGEFSSLGGPSLGAISYSGPGGWLSAALPGGSDTALLEAASGGLGVGTYTATVPVNSPYGGSAIMAVTLSVTPRSAAPDLVVSSSAVFFSALEGGGDPDSQSISLANAGGGGFGDLEPLSLGGVEYGAGASGWLTPSRTGDRITLDVATGALTAGSYSATFSVSGTVGGSETVTVAFDVSPAGAPTALGLGTDQVAFVALAGGGDPTVRVIPVFNTGAGALGNVDLGSISYGPGPSGWLDDSSNSNQDVTLVARTGSLDPGAYLATVEVTSQNGGSRTLTVGFTVGTARLTLSPGAVSFSGPQGGADPPAQEISISNTGAGSFPDLGSVTRGAIAYGPGGSGWLGNPLPVGDALILSSATGGLSAGTYTATVPVTSSGGGSDAVSVTLTVARPSDAPALAVSASAVEFVAVTGAPSPSGKTIALSNSGGGGLGDLGTLGAGAVSYGTAPSGWLGNPQPVGSSLTLSPATPTLPAGTHTATFEVNSQFGGSRSVVVTVQVLDPVLTAATRRLSFTGQAGGSNPPSQSVSFSNTGAGDFTDLGAVTVQSVTFGTGPTGWLVAPQTGSTVAGSSLPFSVSTAGLVPGTYAAEVEVSSEWGGSQPLGVTLSVVRDTDPPRLGLSATTMRFGALVGGDDPEPQSVFVTNVGGGSLGQLQAGPPSYGVGATGWLQAVLAGDSLEVRAAPGLLARGTYTASLPVASGNGGTEALDVTFVVGSPRLTAAPRTVSVSDTLAGLGPDRVTVSLANTGGGIFSSLGALSVEPVFYGEGPSGWLTAVLSGGSLILTAETMGLGARSAPYQALVPVESIHGGGDTVSVAFTVAPGASPARLSLSLDSLTFSGILGGEDPAPQTVIGFNAGGSALGALSIREVLYLGAAGDWLEASVTGTSLTFQPRMAGVPAGTHGARVRVGSENGGDLDLGAVLEVARPVLGLSSRTVSFSDTLRSPDTLRSQVFITNTGAGIRPDLGAVTVGQVIYPQGGSGWLRTIPAPGGTVEGFLVALEGLAAQVPEGTSVALVPVVSQWGGSDTVRVTFSSRRPDRSFDLPTIELVRDTVAGGTTVTVPLPGDSIVVQAPRGSTAQIGARVGVRNASETRVTLSGLRVGTPTYPQGQGGGWITGAFLDRTSATFSRPAELFVVVEPGGLAPGRYEGSLVVSAEAVGLEQVASRTLRMVLVVQ